MNAIPNAVICASQDAFYQQKNKVEEAKLQVVEIKKELENAEKALALLLPDLRDLAFFLDNHVASGEYVEWAEKIERGDQHE